MDTIHQPETSDAEPVFTDSDDAVENYKFSNKLVTVSQPGSLRSEAISALRSHLLAQHIGDGRRALSICAAAAGAGCSYLSANLAVAMSQAGVKTLLIDANLREPAIQDYIVPPAGDGNEAGLLDCLKNESSFGDAIHGNVLPNLSILYAGAEQANNVQELLARDAFRKIAETSMRDFDITIVDTPPANLHADSRRIASAFRYALVVARQDETFVNDIKKLVEDLRSDRADVIGSFVNDY